MPEVLILEDSRLFGVLLSNQIKSRLGLGTRWVKTYCEAGQAIAEVGAEGFLAAIVDLNLPDASGDEAVDLVVGMEIPCIVFTGDYDREICNHMWEKNIADYVLKKGYHNVDYIIALLDRLGKNKWVKALVVDDSSMVRRKVAGLLRNHLYQVIEASNGKDAHEIVEGDPDIKLVITDFEMPGMDGCALTSAIRNKHGKEKVAIIGISAVEDPTLTVQFIKNGANDFLAKPFQTEEFYCRVTQNVQMLEYVEDLKRMSESDYLTGLCNRRFFFKYAYKLHASAKRDHLSMSVAMIDIDHFKAVNDTYGHARGDAALKALAGELSSRFRASDLVARFGGEEFCVLIAGADPDKVPDLFESLRKQVENLRVPSSEGEFGFTVSIGVCSRVMNTLEETVNQADAMLYQAKEQGRNRVIELPR